MTIYDHVIERLASNLTPVSKYAVAQRLGAGIGGGALGSALLMTVLIGIRPDIAAASLTVMFWVKSGYTLALAALSLWCMERLARPAESARRRSRWLLAPLLILFLLTIVEFIFSSTPTYRALIMGSGSALICFSCITVLAVPPLVGLIWAMRGLAPTDLRTAGVATGLAAGGAGAFVYALHCTESSAAFVAVWYTLGAATIAIAGWFLGPRLLRWH